jgi:hypothetical protein
LCTEIERIAANQHQLRFWKIGQHFFKNRGNSSTPFLRMMVPIYKMSPLVYCALGILELLKRQTVVDGLYRLVFDLKIY